MACQLAVQLEDQEVMQLELHAQRQTFRYPLLPGTQVAQQGPEVLP